MLILVVKFLMAAEGFLLVEELRLLGVRKMRNKILPTFIGVVIINFCLAFLLFRYNGTDLGIKNTIILLSDDLCVQIPYIIV